MNQEIDSKHSASWIDCVENFREQNQSIDAYNQLVFGKVTDGNGGIAQRWIKNGTFNDDACVVYTNAADLRNEGGIIKMWTMTDCKDVQTVDKRSFFSAKALREYDCRNGKIRGIYHSEHSGRMGNGSVSYRWAKPMIWQRVPQRGSVMEALWKSACEQR